LFFFLKKNHLEKNVHLVNQHKEPAGRVLLSRSLELKMCVLPLAPSLKDRLCSHHIILTKGEARGLLFMNFCKCGV
jgi:hypothetical protein